MHHIEVCELQRKLQKPSLCLSPGNILIIGLHYMDREIISRMCNTFECEHQIIRIMCPVLYLVEISTLYVNRVKMLWILRLWKRQLQRPDM